jgi:hypothetical protein
MTATGTDIPKETHALLENIDYCSYLFVRDEADADLC